MEKLLPQNIEAECGVLGSIIIDPEAIVQVADFLQPEDFYRDAHRIIYETIIQLYEQREPADFITICDELERSNKLEAVGGPAYITSLVNQVPTSGNVEHYGRIVERMAILRRLIHAAGQIAAVAYEEDDANVAIDKAEQLIFGISQRHARSDFSNLHDLLSDYMAKLDQLHERRGSIVGVPTGFTDLDRLTGGLQKSDLIILAARPAVGKCEAHWTLIDDPETGERITIEECVKRRQQKILNLSEDGKIQVAEIGDWIDSGIKPCYRVRTRLGREVDVTGHHPFLTVQGWKPLYELQAGDHIAVPTSVECFGTDESWPIEKVRLLAYYIAEGSLTTSSPEFTNADPIIVEDFKQTINALYPECKVKQEGVKGMHYRVTQKQCYTADRKRSPNPVVVWLKELSLWGKLAQDKFFPPCAWKWSRRYLAEFIRALMSCDGSIYPHSETGSPYIEFSVASKQLAADLYHAFLRFGIVSKFYQKTKRCWTVLVTTPEHVKRYQDEIGWIGEKTTRFAEYEHKITSRGGNHGNAPKETWMIIRDCAQEQKLSLAVLAYKSGQTTKQGKYAGYKAHTSQSISRTRLSAFADELDSPALRRIASPDIYWDKIVSIEPIGEHQVYDLSVPDGANFIAQDVFVHNTSLCLSIAHNAAVKHGRSVAVFSLEMSKEQLVQRLLSMDAAIDQQRLRTGWIEDDEWERIVFAMGTLAEANIWIDDTAGISTMEMRSKARRLQAEHGVDMIIVDYLQLMQSSAGNKRNENRVQEISEISRSLKGLARELDVPVMALAQLSRAVESRQSKVPQLSDLRESGCLTGDTPVYLPDEGVYKPIAHLVGKKGFRVLALNTETWRLEPREVTNAFTTGRKPVYRMTTRLGRTIRATGNHKFLTIHGWKPLEELTKDDRIALPRRLVGPTQATMTDDELALLGHLIGDGCTLPRHAIQYTTNDEKLADVVAYLAKSVFGDDIVPRIQKERDWYQVYLSAGYHLTHETRNPITEWLRELKVFGLRSHEKYIPEKVFAQPAGSIGKFLRHLWSTDGCIHMSKTGHYPGIYYASSSTLLVQQVQSLLLRLGINATISRKPQGGKGRDQYHVTVSGKSEIERFFQQVGGLGQKKEAYQIAIVEHLASRGEKTNRDIIPRGVWELIKAEVLDTEHAGARLYKGAVAGSRTVYPANQMSRDFTRQRAATVAQVVKSRQLALLAESDVYWDKIISVEEDGEEDVYDLTVDILHNFVAADMLPKNSIEQDADIVMFIYRDDVYNPDSERKNIADIIVAKHRNGPVGEVSLFFQASQTRFTDLEVTQQPEE